MGGKMPKARIPAIDRFWAMVQYCPSGCWEWTGAKSDGYGLFSTSGAKGSMGAHRWIYESVMGPVAADLEIDHLCRNRACVNLAHLEAVTRQENISRRTAFM